LNRITNDLCALVIYAGVHGVRVPRKLDSDRAEKQKRLTATIAERDATIHKLSEKPKRSAAQQHDYEVVQNALKLLGEKGVEALRHIRTHDALTFGTYPPVLPVGLSNADTLWVYNHAASEGILTVGGKVAIGERTFSVSPKMELILDELLYEN